MTIEIVQQFFVNFRKIKFRGNIIRRVSEHCIHPDVRKDGQMDTVFL